MRKENNPSNRKYKHQLFLPGGNNTYPSIMFLSLKLDIGGHEPTINHNAPSWSCNLPLGQSNNGNEQHARITLEHKYKKRRTKSEHSLIIHHIPANSTKQQQKNYIGPQSCKAAHED